MQERIAMPGRRRCPFRLSVDVQEAIDMEEADRVRVYDHSCSWGHLWDSTAHEATSRERIKYTKRL